MMMAYFIAFRILIVVEFFTNFLLFTLYFMDTFKLPA